MDQNVIRTDLLPESMATGLLAVLAVFGVALWMGCHWALRRYGSNRFNVWRRALMNLPLGTAGAWFVLQFLARLVFLATPWPLYLCALAGAAALELVSAFYVHECSRVPPPTARILVACRMAAVATALVVLLQPVLIGERERTVNRRVVVLVDDSASMHFKDGLLTEDERRDLEEALGAKLPEGGLTRAEMIRRLAQVGGEESFLRRTAARYTVDVFRFGNGLERDEAVMRGEAVDEGAARDAREEMFRSTTDITRALERVLSEVPPEEITSIILLTDGRHNGDAGVESVARRLGGYGIAVSTVVIGGTVKPFDLSIAAADSRESVFLGDKIRFTIRVAATHANGRRAAIRFSSGEEGLIEERSFTVEGEDWSKEFKFVHVPEGKGVYGYRFEVTHLDGELFADNNVRALEVAVSDDRTNVLLVDGRPRWEYRYLRNLFYGRDKSVHLQDWLVHPDTIAGVEAIRPPPASASRPFGDSEAGDWPVDADEWRKFDVIILGDIAPTVLDARVIERLRYCVEERGALLVVICGSEYMPHAVTDETFRALLPITYTPGATSRRAAPEDNFRFTLAPAGRGHTVMSQSSSPSENEEIWDALPDFHWRLPVEGVKPGSDVLAFAQPAGGDRGPKATISIASLIEEDPEAALRRLEDLRDRESRNALITACPRGRGRVLMLTTDSMWRLRTKAGDERHHRFWGQVMRWGAGERLRAGNEHVRIGTDQLRYGAGEEVRAYVRILDKMFNGVQGLDPRLVVTPPEGSGRKPFALYPTPRPDANGFYECAIPGCVEPGVYTLTLECAAAAGVIGRLYPPCLTTKFVVVTTKQPAEEVEITATRDAAERIARATGGSVLSPSAYVKLSEDFGGGSKQVQDRVELNLWSLPPLFILIVAFLTVEWIFRKRVSLV
ncbi:MAG: hypothetical protein ACI4R9_02835 [Kiritimatiellia bacterium]